MFNSLFADQYVNFIRNASTCILRQPSFLLIDFSLQTMCMCAQVSSTNSIPPDVKGCVVGPSVFVANPAGTRCTNDLTDMKNVDAVAELDLTVSDTSKLYDVQ